MDFLLPFENTLLVQKLAACLLHFSWQAILVVVFLKVLLIFTPQQAYQTRYRMAVFAMVLLCLSPLLTFQSIELKSSAQSVYSPDSSNSMLQSANEYQVSDPTNLEHTPTQATTEAALSVRHENSSEAASQMFEFSLSNLISQQDLVLIWLVGMLLALIKYCYDVVSTYRLVYKGVKPVDSELQSTLDSLISRMAIKQKVNLLVSSKVDIPVVIGWVKPVILLPLAIAVGLDRQQLSLILAHELAHIRRYDFLVNLMQGVAQVVFFFHPAVYWLNKVIREEREFICDNAALQALGDSQNNRIDLCKALLNTAELKQGNYSLVAVAATDGHLKKRVYRIVASENKQLPSLKSLTTLVLAFIISLAAMASTSSFDVESSANNSIQYSVNSAGTDFSNVLNKQGKSINLASTSRLNLVNDSVLMQSLSILSEPEETKINESEAEKTLKLSKKGSQPKFAKSAQLESPTQPKNSSLSQKIAKLDSKELKTKQSIKRSAVKPELTEGRKKDALLTAKSVIMGNTETNFDSPDFIVSSTQANQNPTVESEVLPATFVRSKVADVEMKELLLETKVTSEFDEVFIEPKAVSTPYPRYPAEAFAQKLSGQVKVDFTIDENGNVDDLKFSTDNARIFVSEIKSKLRRWKYEPAQRNGERVAHKATMFFEFDVPETRPFYIRETGSRIKRLVYQ